MGQSSFRFQQFEIHQDQCAMKVGTDGVLLGAWACRGISEDAKIRILDVGTGTGLVALMLAQRFKNALVDAIEIDNSTGRQALENVAHSPFACRVNVMIESLQQWYQSVGALWSKYDVVVSNPPYYDQSLKNPDAKRALARHTDTLSFRELFQCTSGLLTFSGRCFFIIPIEALSVVRAEANWAGLNLEEFCGVRTVPSKPIRRCLLSFSKQRPTSIIKSEQMLCMSDGSRSSWYEELTRDFYLPRP